MNKGNTEKIILAIYDAGCCNGNIFSAKDIEEISGVNGANVSPIISKLCKAAILRKVRYVDGKSKAFLYSVLSADRLLSYKDHGEDRKKKIDDLEQKKVIEPKIKEVAEIDVKAAFSQSIQKMLSYVTALEKELEIWKKSTQEYKDAMNHYCTLLKQRKEVYLQVRDDEAN